MNPPDPDEAFEPEGEPGPVREPDDTLRLTDNGLEMPDFLQGFVGEFTVRTPSLTGEFETTTHGLPESDFYDGIIAVYPESGDFHGDLEEGMLAISIPEHREMIYEIDDQRTEDGDGE